ncbi:hypothetical protein [Monaibacterium marinum]|uniref:hypothetical protein n=1 Tax=Pontivivens marinum TaxID=1690039 RepID=UPI000BF1A048|nr:hypothetical protein [Monaibacterium marinum]
MDNPASGGGAGTAGRVELTDGTKLRIKGQQLVRSGQRLRLSLLGGGGYGASAGRDETLIAKYLRAVKITPAQAKHDYGFKG